MKRLRKLSRYLFSLSLIVLLVIPVTVQSETVREYIAIRKEGAGRIAVVLDKTKGATGGKESGWTGNFDQTVNGALGFTGLFNLLPAPLNVWSDGGFLNIAAVSSIGADVFVSGKLTQAAGAPVFDMQVRDATGKLLLNRRYSGPVSNLRQTGLKFAVDLVELLTGKRSVFDSSIYFVSNRTGHKEIYRCDFDGSNVRQITSTGSISLTPSLSKNGKYLAWTDYSSGRPDLYIRNLSTNTTASVKKQGVFISPAWRPGSDMCATTLSFEGDQDIYLIRADGSVDRRLTRGAGIDVSPTFSPDGSKMAYVSTREGRPQIFIQDLTSGAVRRLTYSGNYNTQPAWSPAGDKILFTSLQKSGEINIFAINPDGSGLMQLTGGSNNNEYPSWSPDASMIVFSSNRQGKRKLFVMNADGAAQRPLLAMEGEQQQPSWSSGR